MKRVFRENEAVLIKCASIDLGQDRFMVVIMYYHPTYRSKDEKSVWRCCMRIDARKRWMRKANDLRFENPAEPFNTSMIDLPDSFLIYNHRRFIRSDMARWLRKRFYGEKVKTMRGFVDGVVGKARKYPFLLFYDVDGERVHISDTYKIPEGRWFIGIPNEPKGRRRNRIIQ